MKRTRNGFTKNIPSSPIYVPNPFIISVADQLRDLVVRAFACEAWLAGYDSQLDHTKDFKMVSSCCFSCFNAQHLRVTQRIKKQSVDYMSVKVKLIQSWRYKVVKKAQ